LNQTPLDILKRYWGYTSFRPLQEKVIQEVLAGTDVFVLMPTGGGKSMTYQIPGLILPGVCIVVSPLIALIKDQVRQLKERGIHAAYILSGMNSGEIDRVLDNAVFEQYRFLYVSPERLKSPLFIERFKRMKVSFIAVDEAHCISQWGYDFRPAYLEIAEIRKHQPRANIIALTASAIPRVVKDVQEKLLFLRPNVLQRSFARENLYYIVQEESNKNRRLLAWLERIKGTAIAYVRNRKSTHDISQWLIHEGISSMPYHAGIPTQKKDEIQAAWQKGEVRVIVATNAFGMGIDKSNVRLVVHMDVPDSIEAYFQEAGRAGRDGLRAYAVLLYASYDLKQLRDRVGWNFPPIDTIKNVYHDLGNYLQLAIGSGLNDTFPFDMVEFANRSDLRLYDVYSSLRILEREGYLQLSESIHTPSRLKMLAGANDLYYFEVAHPDFEKLIKTLLRSYAGLFDEFQKINEKVLAKRLQIPVEFVIDKLNYLSSLNLLEYIPANDQPKITWLIERLPKDRVYISYEQYGMLKERQADRCEKFIDYLTKNQCRNIQLLAYFGEEGKKCGKCDVCAAEKQNKPNMQKLENEIIALIKKQPQNLDSILRAVSANKEDWVLEIIRYLADEGWVRRDRFNRWEWKA
jgi:ATP-dependent DNA helicase RecQ